MSIYDRMPPLFEQLPKEEQLKVITPSLSANIQRGMILDNSNTPSNTRII